MSNPLLGDHCLVSQMVWTIIIILRFCRKNLQKRSQRQVGKAMHSWQKWQITRSKYGEGIFLFSNTKRELRNWGWDKLWLPDTIWSDWRRIFMVWSLVIDNQFIFSFVKFRLCRSGMSFLGGHIFQPSINNASKNFYKWHHEWFYDSTPFDYQYIK